MTDEYQSAFPSDGEGQLDEQTPEERAAERRAAQQNLNDTLNEAVENEDRR